MMCVLSIPCMQRQCILNTIRRVQNGEGLGTRLFFTFCGFTLESQVHEGSGPHGNKVELV